MEFSLWQYDGREMVAETQVRATRSISTRAPLGSSATATVERDLPGREDKSINLDRLFIRTDCLGGTIGLHRFPLHLFFSFAEDTNHPTIGLIKLANG